VDGILIANESWFSFCYFFIASILLESSKSRFTLLLKLLNRKIKDYYGILIAHESCFSFCYFFIATKFLESLKSRFTLF